MAIAKSEIEGEQYPQPGEAGESRQHVIEGEGLSETDQVGQLAVGSQLESLSGIEPLIPGEEAAGEAANKTDHLHVVSGGDVPPSEVPAAKEPTGLFVDLFQVLDIYNMAKVTPGASQLRQALERCGIVLTTQDIETMLNEAVTAGWVEQHGSPEYPQYALPGRAQEASPAQSHVVAQEPKTKQIAEKLTPPRGQNTAPAKKQSTPSPRAAAYASTGSSGSRRRKNDAEEDPVRLYLHDIGKRPLLTKDDEYELNELIRIGDEAKKELEQLRAQGATAGAKVRNLRRAIREGESATTRFIESNLRLVVSIAKRYQSSGLELLDLIQEGNFGMMHAVEKFDARKGFKFSTYATWWIRQSITRGIANTGRTIRLPVHAGDKLVLLGKAWNRLSVKLQGEPSLAALAEELEWSHDLVEEVMLFGATTAHLDEPLHHGEEATLGDITADPHGSGIEEAVDRMAILAIIPEALARLDQREREVIKLRYGLDTGEPRTLEEVGKEFNLTRERIRQIESRALAKFRHPSFSDVIPRSQ